MDGGATVTVMESVTTAMGDVLEFAGTILTEITEQPILLFIFAAGLVPIGFRILKGLKRTARQYVLNKGEVFTSPYIFK